MTSKPKRLAAKRKHSPFLSSAKWKRNGAPLNAVVMAAMRGISNGRLREGDTIGIALNGEIVIAGPG
jgi:hypothetical protein